MDVRSLVGALALVCLMMTGTVPAMAAGWPIVTGKCLCGTIGWGMHFADCGRRICTKVLCSKACTPKKTSAAAPTDVSAAHRYSLPRPKPYSSQWDMSAPPRPGYEFRSMWSHAAKVRTHGHRQARGTWRRATLAAARPARIARQALAGAVGASLAGLPAELVSKVLELGTACGMRAISTFRPGALVAGTHIRSLHGFHKAADISGGDFSCAYAHLQGWPGGVSIDRLAGGPVRDHIHLSFAPGSAEWGARFCHLGACGGHRTAGHRSVKRYYARHGRGRRV